MACFGLTSEPFLFLQSASFATIRIIQPLFLQYKVCHNMYNASVCNSASTKHKSYEDRVQEIASFWLTLIPASTYALACIAVLLVGPLADAVGKKKVMVLCPALTLIQWLIYFVYSLISGYFHPALLFIPDIVPALLGGNSGDILLSLAYKADITKRVDRTRGISKNEGFYYFATALAGIVGGVLIKLQGFQAVICLNMALSIINLIYVTLVLPDEEFLKRKISREKENESEVTEDDSKEGDEGEILLKHHTSVDGTSEVFDEMTTLKAKLSQVDLKSLFRLNDIRRVLTIRKNGYTIWIYLAIFFFVEFGKMGLISTGILYLSHSPFSLTKDAVSYFSAAVGFAEAFGSLFVLPLLQYFLSMNDIHLLILGCLAGTVYAIHMGLAKWVWMLYVSNLLLLFMVLPMPVSRSLISKHVTNDLHASALAIGEVAALLGTLTASFIGNLIYSETVAIYPGLVMFCIALSDIIGLSLSLVLLYLHSKGRKS